MIVRKHLLAPGTYWVWNERLKRTVPVMYTKEDLDLAEQESLRAMTLSGYRPYVPWEHQQDAGPKSFDDNMADSVKHNTGWGAGYSRDADGSLYVDLDIKDELAQEKIGNGTVRYVSPMIYPSVTLGDGRTYRNLITHVALTSKPVWQGQRPFVGDDGAALSLNLDGDDEPIDASTLSDPVCLSLANAIRFAWQAGQTKRGTVKAIGTETHMGKVLYGRKAEAALRGRKKRDPNAPPKSARERVAKAGPVTDEHRKGLSAELAKHEEVTLNDAQKKSVNRAFGQLKRNHGDNVLHGIREMVAKDLKQLATGQGDPGKLKARLQGYREMLRKLGSAEKPVGKPEPSKATDAKPAEKPKGDGATPSSTAKPKPNDVVGKIKALVEESFRPGGLTEAEVAGAMKDLQARSLPELQAVAKEINVGSVLRPGTSEKGAYKSRGKLLSAIESKIREADYARESIRVSLTFPDEPNPPFKGSVAMAKDDDDDLFGDLEENDDDMGGDDMGDDDGTPESGIDEAALQQEIQKLTQRFAQFNPPLVIDPSHGVEDFFKHLCTAMDNHPLTSGAGDSAMSNTNTQTPPPHEEQPQVVAMSQRLAQAENRLAQAELVNLTNEVKALVNKGQMSPARAKKLLEEAGAKKLSLIAGGSATSHIQTQLEQAREVPEGTFWDAKERAVRLSRVHEAPDAPDWDGDGSAKPDPDVMAKLTGGKWKPAEAAK